jgi:choline dehydrogenase-like flavoprotein
MHDVENLWVVDSSFMPSSAAMNPGLTIAANAVRVTTQSVLPHLEQRDPRRSEGRANGPS